MVPRKWVNREHRQHLAQSLHRCLVGAAPATVSGSHWFVHECREPLSPNGDGKVEPSGYDPQARRPAIVHQPCRRAGCTEGWRIYMLNSYSRFSQSGVLLVICETWRN